MIRVAIIGASGYTASESLKILARHREVEVTYLAATQDRGPIADNFPQLGSLFDLEVKEYNPAQAAELADVILCCLPHKAAMDSVADLVSKGLKVVDFSADYRIHDVNLYEEVYQVTHSDPDNIAKSAFGLPELFRENIKGKQLVANPGCYPTAASLGLAPLLKEKLIDPSDIIVNAVSGASGAGRKPAQKFHFPEMTENIFAYGVQGHRHNPEIDQILSEFSDSQVKTLFMPHVGCYERGIIETIYCKPLKDISQQQLDNLYKQYYSDEIFIRLRNCPPAARDVANSNFCDIYPIVSRGRVIVFSAIDNLIKGAAGQAIQNMNIICDLNETEGLL